MDYRRWFSRNQPLDLIYTTTLPSLHRVAHVFLNNILTPKAKIKTNLEFAGLFYMHHLISLDEVQPHIPYIILRHMRTAYNYSHHTLPYANIIQRILSCNNINPPIGVDLSDPINLCDELTTMGWIEDEVDGINTLILDNRSINEWIWATNALPNQYWNPSTDTSTQGESSSSQFSGNTMKEQVNWIAQQVGNLTVGMNNLQEMFQKHQAMSDERYKVMFTKVENIEAIQTGFYQRFNRHFPEEDDNDD